MSLRYKCKEIRIPDPQQNPAYGGKMIMITKKICELQELIDGKWVKVPEVFEDNTKNDKELEILIEEYGWAYHESIEYGGEFDRYEREAKQALLDYIEQRYEGKK